MAGAINQDDDTQDDQQDSGGAIPASSSDSGGGALSSASPALMQQSQSQMPPRSDVLAKRQALDDAIQKLSSAQANPGYNLALAGFANGASPNSWQTKALQGMQAGQMQQATIPAAADVERAKLGTAQSQQDIDNYAKFNEHKAITDPYGNIIAYNPYNLQDKASLSTGPFGGGMGSAGSGGAGAVQGGAQAPRLSGDDFLQTLPPAASAQVKALAEGRQAFPSGYAMTKPYNQALLAAVSQYDPNFDALNYNKRAETIKSFSPGGADANNVAAINTAVTHALSASDAYDRLDNSKLPWLNSITNFVANNEGDANNQKAFADVGTATTAFAGEMAKVFRSSGMAESDIQDWKSKLSTNASDAQKNAVIGEAVELMNGRLNALGEKYNQGMNTKKQGIELLSPIAQQSMLKLQGKNQSSASAGASTPVSRPQAQPAPTSQGLPDGAVHLGKNKAGQDIYQLPDGRKVKEQ